MPEPAPSLLSLLVWQRECWRRGERVGVEQVLSRHPAARPDADALLDLIYNEVVLREEAGESPRLDEYVARFPALAEPLRVQFEVDDALGSAANQDHPQAVEQHATLAATPPDPDPHAWQ